MQVLDCPYCKGRGWFAQRIATSPGRKGYAKKVNCKRCGGAGTMEVSDGRKT